MKKDNKNYLILAAAALVIFILDFTPIFQPAKNFFASFANPLLVYFREKKQELTFVKEDQKLKQELVSCQSQLLKKEQLEEENRRLRRLLQLPLPEDLNFIDAKVIVQEKDFFIINKGEKEGAQKGQLVLVDNFLIGKIFKIEEERSQVLRVDSPQFSAPVLIFSNKVGCLGQEKIKDICQKGKGILRGEEIKEILREEEVETGDLVTLLDSPNGILVGEVIEVKESQDKVFKEAKIKREISLGKVVDVFLVKK